MGTQCHGMIQSKLLPFIPKPLIYIKMNYRYIGIREVYDTIKLVQQWW